MSPVESPGLERTAVILRFGNSPLSISDGNPKLICHTLPLLVPAKSIPNACFETSIAVISSRSAQPPAGTAGAFAWVRSPVAAVHVVALLVVCQMRQVPKYRLLLMFGSITSGGINPMVSCDAVISVSAGLNEG